ncbi:hypothetical protein PVAP13_3KG249354 [Panicum virgatum]|uniref:DUF6598 domain-containing protein n=1 Tax=Panicum virgatum TaxID=38727 RepID=A0A8T0V2Q1_PANVG|nr:hypothetical protein PVAP13_3KG249354 [Panicum virgatum]
MDSSQMKQGTFDADGRKITSTGGSWSTRMRHAFIVENSTHRDGAIYKENWGYWGQGCPYNLADRTEIVILTDIYASSTNLNLDHTCTNLSSGDYPTHTQIHVGIIFREIIVPCFPEPECCVEHFSNEMVQIFSLMLAKTPIKSDSIQMYGYFAARDYLDGHLNYVFNRSRDNPVVVQQGSLIEMTGPSRGICMCSEREREDDDLQLIDGLITLGEYMSRRPFTLRFNGSSGGAVDMCLTLIDKGMEAIIDVVISKVQSTFDLSLSSFVPVMEEYKEVKLFHGTVGEMCQKRFVVAIPVDTMMQLKFKVAKGGADDEIVHFCSVGSNHYECVSRHIKFEEACVSVKMTVLPYT